MWAGGRRTTGSTFFLAAGYFVVLLANVFAAGAGRSDVGKVQSTVPLLRRNGSKVSVNVDVFFCTHATDRHFLKCRSVA